jgi:hypothetical protein
MDKSIEIIDGKTEIKSRGKMIVDENLEITQKDI